MRPVDTSRCMQGASSVGSVDHRSFFLAQSLSADEGVQGEEPDLLLDIPTGDGVGGAVETAGELRVLLDDGLTFVITDMEQ